MPSVTDINFFPHHIPFAVSLNLSQISIGCICTSDNKSVVFSTGGGDTPEAVADAIKEVINLNWDEDQRPHTVRMAVLIGDSPPHGTPGLTYDDEFPNGKFLKALDNEIQYVKF